MRVLVMGGTRFLGWAVVQEALDRGDEVTTFTRGESGEPPPRVRALHGDRTRADDLAQLRGLEFDVVVDTCGFTPTHVNASAGLLADQAGHYVFVSTINVYPDWPGEPVRADSKVHDCPPDAGENDGPQDDTARYGYLKAGCERAVEQHFPGRSTQVRSGLLVGPHDNTARLTSWLDRISRGGRTAVPGPADRRLSFTDVRDMAAWMLHCGQSGVSGAFNTTGPSDMVSYGELFEACRAATGSDAEFVWVPEEVIEAQDVQPWTELPLWMPSEYVHTFDVDVSATLAAGLTLRPVADTARDTWEWQRVNGYEKQDGRGLPADKEAALLAAMG